MTEEQPNSFRRPGKTGKITTLIADDHPLYRKSLRSVLGEELDFQIVGEADDGEEAVRLADELQPDVVLMDITMPKLDGLEATRQIKASHPHMAVLVLTIHSDDQNILGILEAGAAGYLLKSVRGHELINAVRQVYTGESVLHPAIARKVLNRFVPTPGKTVGQKPFQLTHAFSFASHQNYRRDYNGFL